MLKLARQQILLGQSVTTKADAIAPLANKLTDAGLVGSRLRGRHAGAGSAARHLSWQRYRHSPRHHGHPSSGEEHRRHGGPVPHGIEWDEGQIAYVAIGIAAKSDEHLGILRQLTHVLGDEQAAAQLKGRPTKRPSSIS